MSSVLSKTTIEAVAMQLFQREIPKFMATCFQSFADQLEQAANEISPSNPAESLKRGLLAAAEIARSTAESAKDMKFDK